MKVRTWVLPVLLVVALGACSETDGVTGVEALAVAGADAKGPTLVEAALAENQATGEFSTLVAALVAADLVDAIAAPGQRTVFAPTDAAFAELGLDAGNIGTVDVATLTEILLYHVTPGRRGATSVVSANRLRMLNGGFTAITRQNGGVYINDAAIVRTDLTAGNGIIHVIDGVLLP
jgi:uncharacterized surface protein with fasciclin (FAS1) repeats